MKKSIIFILVFLLSFTFQIRFAQGLSPSQCRYFNMIDGSCLSGSGYFWEVTEISPPAEVPTTPQPVIPTEIISVPHIFMTLVIQFFSIVILTILLVILLQSLIESG